VTGAEGKAGSAWLDAGDAARLAECIAAGGVALFPSDTVYGLACDPLQPHAVRRLYELKGRPPARPAAVMFFALAPALEALPELAARERAALEALLPGPLTLLLPNPAERFPLACAPAGPTSPGGGVAAKAADAPAAPANGTAAPADGSTAGSPGALGLRVPLLPANLAALRELERPVMQSSANLSGGPEARRLMEVPRALREGADLVLDGGELPGIASTVLDLRYYEHDGDWRIVREGPVGRAELERALDRA
jgi:L-threonylcarbamoyladenylate synthase